MVCVCVREVVSVYSVTESTSSSSLVCGLSSSVPDNTVTSSLVCGLSSSVPDNTVTSSLVCGLSSSVPDNTVTSSLSEFQTHEACTAYTWGKITHTRKLNQKWLVSITEIGLNTLDSNWTDSALL